MKKLILLLFAFCVTAHTYSQNTEERKKESLIITVTPRFGFNAGADYSITNNYTALDTFAIYPSTIHNGPGARMGMFGELKIQQRFTLSFKSELSYSSATIMQDSTTYNLNPINLDFMLHGKFNFRKRGAKVNPYTYFGPALRTPINGQSQDNFETKRSWSGDIAFGLDIDLGSLYISPEIRYSRGLSNIKKEETWEKLRSSYVAFVLNFTLK